MLAWGMAGSRDSDDVATVIVTTNHLFLSSLLCSFIFLAPSSLPTGFLTQAGASGGRWQQANHTLSFKWKKGTLSPSPEHSC